MPRKKSSKTLQRELKPDPIFQSVSIQALVNQVLKDGKKALAYRLVYGVMDEIENQTQQNPVQVVEQAIQNATPSTLVKSKRVRGSTFQTPNTLDPRRGRSIAIRWILQAARSRGGKGMVSKLSQEILDASQQLGGAVKRRDEMHRMAESNRRS
uniref:Small ribosomal subunit protein uS7c n=1 Tax=Chloropicon sieburthii TaxID=1764286 RepID=A0A4D6C1J0_9CHLO|nr:ribosomal protein S7 [Chloropicon sieburthii]QBX97665.1 ribosomal protein S7 [Chloropicon sieburthii]